MFIPNLNMFIEVWGFSDQYKKRKLTQNWLSKCALRFFIGSPVRHVADIYAGGGHPRRPVDWASDSSRKSLMLNILDLFMYLKNIHIYFITILTAYFYRWKTFEIFKSNLHMLINVWGSYH